MILITNGDHFPVWHMESGLCIVKCVCSVGNETGCRLINKIISNFIYNLGLFSSVNRWSLIAESWVPSQAISYEIF